MSKWQPDVNQFMTEAERERELRSEYLRALEEKALIMEGLPHLYRDKHYKWSRQFFESRNRRVFLTAANQIGKAQCIDTRIPVLGGFKRLGDIAIGDYVLGGDGKPTRVIAIPFDAYDECYRITFDDGEVITASKNHLWEGYLPNARWRDGHRGTYTTGEIIEKCKYHPGTRNYNKFKIEVIDDAFIGSCTKDDAYEVGLLIGDGCTVRGGQTICTPDKLIEEYLHAKYDSHTHKQTTRIKGEAGKRLSAIVGHCYSFEKRLPEAYLYSDRGTRESLLAGLMDTDGTCTKNGLLSYCTTSEGLKDDFVVLVSSLGGLVNSVQERYTTYKVRGEKRTGRKSYVVWFRVKFNPFRLPRKSVRWRLNTRYSHCKLINKVEYVGVKRCRCITVANEDGLYLCGRQFTITHNSSINIKKCIEWAGNTKLWGDVFPGQQPNQFWYLYPSSAMAAVEFATKWALYLPKGEMKDHPTYGWRVEQKNNVPISIRFNSGVIVYFKYYSQNVSYLQASTVYAVFCDEELPETHYDEINMRLAATQGYFHMVFTATLGQEIWRKTMEPDTVEEALFPEALKIQVSMYDCLQFEDGTDSHWTRSSIKAIEASCKSKAEILRRVFGRFIKSEDRRFPKFNIMRHMVEGFMVPHGWNYYVGIDLGSSAVTRLSHKAAICFLAVEPKYQKGVVVDCWEAGDDKATTAGDVFDKYLEMCGRLGFIPPHRYYDFANADFGIIAARANHPFQRATKGRDDGIQTLNSLFENDMLFVEKLGESANKLAIQLSNLPEKLNTASARRDDISDALRYAAMGVVWDWSLLLGKAPVLFDEAGEGVVVEEVAPKRKKDKGRPDWLLYGEKRVQEGGGWDDESDFWNGLY